ncbi:hypothetical protein [Paenibacillus flagellatus]|uniref:DUF2759 domain-containing protein n=1 Tax=Paenibacillus flagellatus TaxID=2211139 RepID=A0A2V5JX43_9BACL|nr:hypothetical protein [Paenibacillus flagellatus]PYI51211.1 hypothetical protein DLM86_26370 [Paenibacillus flagellatus]
MFLAEEAAAGSASNFHTFDIFMVLFTILVVVGLLRLLAAPVKNKFAIGFTSVSLLVFLILDVLMVQAWMG